ncbi:MAG: leucine-rich repeat protein [Bacteroidaceae bacterium]|nr:leucine-rich repeat protein [Bacteroidaceae bacterium]
MKKLLTLFALMLVCIGQTFAYDFEVNGIYYNKSGSNASVTFATLDFKSYSGIVVIPATVIYNDVTYNVTSIGEIAFYNCKSLSYVLIPNSVKNIESGAFSGCTGLTSVTIPNSVQSIERGAFQGCSGLTSVSIGSSVTSIRDDAFEGCTGVKELVYADGCKTTMCTHLTSITSVTIPNSVTSIGNGAFSGCSGLTSVTIPSSVTSIGSSAFQSCSGLTSVTIPNSVTSIGDEAFYGCTGLKSVDIGNGVESIGTWAFMGCSGLTSITIGNSVKTIGNHTFSGCTNLTSVTIPGSVTSIESGAFNGCDNVKELIYADGCTTTLQTYLQSITSVIIPNSVTSIGNGAFSGCSGLTSVTIPNSVKNIESGAFSGCTGLTSVTIPSSVTSIGSRAFYGCSGLTSIIIPSSVTGIENYAFYNCSSLTSITIPNSVPSIGGDTFNGCSSLTSVTIGNGVTSIGYHAFEGCTGVKELIYADGCKTALGTGLTSMKSITIPNSVTSIGNGAFSGCSGLTSITIPGSVESIGAQAFSDCTGLTSIAIPSSVESMGDQAFSNCTGLSSVTIPNSVTRIGNAVFEGCTGLASVTVESGNTHYDSRDKCNAIIETASNTLITGCMNTTIPNSVTSIGNYAFYGCSGLTSITIPNSVTSIGEQAFYKCAGLTSVTNYATIPQSINRFTFSVTYGATLHVLKGCASKYGDTGSSWEENYWRGFSIVEDAPPIKATAITLDKTVYSCEVGSVIQAYVSSYIPADATTRQVTWSVADPSIAFVDAKTGQILGLQDGVTTIIATVADGSGVTATAILKVGEGDVTIYTITATPANASMGTVTGSGTYLDGAEVTLTATPNTGYEFKQWSDGTTENPYTFTATGNVNLTASFQNVPYTITATSSDEAKGSVSGSGTYVYGSTVTLTATPEEGYEFKSWSDGSAENPYTFTATADVTLTATFMVPANISTKYYTAPQLRAEADNGTAFIGILGVTTSGDKYINGAYATRTASTERTLATVTAPQSNEILEVIPTEGGYYLRRHDATGDAGYLACEASGDFTVGNQASATVWAILGPDEEGYGTIANYEALYADIAAEPNEHMIRFIAHNQYLNGQGGIHGSPNPNAKGGLRPGTGAWSFNYAYNANYSELAFADGTDYTATDAQTVGQLTYTRNFKNTNWQALYIPFSLDYEEWCDDFDIAEISTYVQYDDNADGDDDRMNLVVEKLDEGSTLANHPYLIRAKSTGTKTLTLTNKVMEAAETNSITCSSAFGSYELTITGTYTEKTDMFAKGYYALSGGRLMQANSASVVLGAQRWYMEVTSRTGGASSVKAQTIKIVVDGEDETEGIEAPFTSPVGGELLPPHPSTSPKGESPVAYDLMGRAVRTAANVRGINISNGKKIIN